MTTTPALNDDLVTRLKEYVAYFDAVETKPTPHELYYAIKNDGEGTGWSYRATGFGPADIREAASALEAQAKEIEALRSALEPTHRHKKRGSEYVLIGIGRMQAENWEVCETAATDEPSHGASVDMAEVAIYRSVDDGSLWVRPREEFEDGRFVEIARIARTGALNHG